MKKSNIRIICLLLIINIISLPASQVDLGYFDFRFFSTPDEIKKLILDTKLADSEAKITDSTREIFSMLYLKQNLVYFDRPTSLFFHLTFTDKIVQLKEHHKDKMYHLTSNDKNSFRLLTVAKNSSEKNKDWQYEFIFYKNELAGIILSFTGAESKGDFIPVTDAYFNACLNKISEKYGAPAVKRALNYSKLTTINYLTWESSRSLQTPQKNAVYSTQLVVTYTTYSGQCCNLQICYLSTDFWMAIKNRMKNGDYIGVSESELIDF
ncbi:MAG TPA: hypothetical protein DC049_00310 [Spirochaetia bacterium]|nr:hypothetical protein [Spirochaetia bacterium]